MNDGNVHSTTWAQYHAKIVQSSRGGNVGGVGPSHTKNHGKPSDSVRAKKNSSRNGTWAHAANDTSPIRVDSPTTNVNESHTICVISKPIKESVPK